MATGAAVAVTAIVGRDRPASEGRASASDLRAASRLLIPVERRSPAPGFTVQTTSGTPFSLDSTRGRVVVFTFLAPGCEDCTAEVQALKAVHATLARRGVDALLLDVGDLPNEEILAYYRTELDGGDHLYAGDVEYRVASAYQVRLLRTTVVVDPKGRVAYRDEDLTPASKLLAVVRRVLEEA